MLIHLTKARADKQGTLRCVRCDGSETWQPSTPYFAMHDLIHYAVETTMNYSEAFFGVVNTGKGLDEFGTREGKRDIYTCEEAWAENIVGLLQWPGANGGADLTEEEFCDQLRRIFEGNPCGPPPVSSEQLRTIKETTAALHAQWLELPEGGRLTLVFDVPVIGTHVLLPLREKLDEGCIESSAALHRIASASLQR